MADLISLLGILKDWGPLATILGLMLIGSWKGVFVWWRQYAELKAEIAELKADFKLRLQKQEESNEKLWTLVLRATGLAEDTIFVAKRKVPHDVP